MTRLQLVDKTVALTLFVGFVYLTTGTGVAWAGGDNCVGESPLPTYKISVSSDDVSKKITDFSGVWVGKWKDGNRKGLCHTLVVKSVNPDGVASVIYSTGVYKPWGIKEGSFSQHKGSISYGELSFTLGNDVKVSYRLSGNELMGNYGYGRSFGSFQKQKDN